MKMQKIAVKKKFEQFIFNVHCAYETYDIMQLMPTDLRTTKSRPTWKNFFVYRESLES